MGSEGKLVGLFHLHEGLAVARKNGGGGSSEAVDALFDITDHKSLATLSDGREDEILNGIYVLIFIDIYGVVAIGE